MICPNCDNPHCAEGKLPCSACGWQKGTPISPRRADLHPKALSGIHGINSLVLTPGGLTQAEAKAAEPEDQAKLSEI